MTKHTTKDPIYKHIQALETQLEAAGFEDDHEIWDDIALAKYAIENPLESDFDGLPYITQESGVSSAMIGIKAAIEEAPESEPLNKCQKTFDEMQNAIGEPHSAISPSSSFHKALAEQLKAFQEATLVLNDETQSTLSEPIANLETLLANIPASGWAATHADAQIINGLNTLKGSLNETNAPESELAQLINTMLETASSAADTERQNAMRNV